MATRTAATGRSAASRSAATRSAATGRTAASSSFSSASQQFFDRLLTPPVDARATLYAALIDALVSAGVWAKLDCLYVYATFDSAASFTNLRSSSFAATATGVPTFAVDQGWTGQNVGNCVSTNFNPSTANGNYAQDDACVFCWSLTANFTGDLPMMDIGNGGSMYLWPNPDPLHFIVNGGSGSVALPAFASGLFIAQRTASDLTSLYQDNNVLIGSHDSESEAPGNANLIAPWGPYELAAAGAGASLDAGQRSALHIALTTYLTGVGSI